MSPSFEGLPKIVSISRLSSKLKIIGQKASPHAEFYISLTILWGKSSKGNKNKVKQKSLSEREGIIQEKKNALISFMRDIWSGVISIKQNYKVMYVEKDREDFIFSNYMIT